MRPAGNRVGGHWERIPLLLIVCEMLSEGAGSVTVTVCGGKENKGAGDR